MSKTEELRERVLKMKNYSVKISSASVSPFQNHNPLTNQDEGNHNRRDSLQINNINGDFLSPN